MKPHWVLFVDLPIYWLTIFTSHWTSQRKIKSLMVAWEVQHVILLPLELSRRYRAPSWFHIRPLPGKQFWVSVALPHLDVATARSDTKSFKQIFKRIFRLPFDKSSQAFHFSSLGANPHFGLGRSRQKKTTRPFPAIRPKFGLCDRGKLFRFWSILLNLEFPF